MNSWRINQVIDPLFSFKTATGPDDRKRFSFFRFETNQISNTTNQNNQVKS